MMDTLAETLFKLGSKLLDRHAIEPIIALLCLHFTAIFIGIAGSLEGSHALLYWLCATIAVVTAAIGLGGLGTYAVRSLFTRRVAQPGDTPTPTEDQRP